MRIREWIKKGKPNLDAVFGGSIIAGVIGVVIGLAIWRIGEYRSFFILFSPCLITIPLAIVLGIRFLFKQALGLASGWDRYKELKDSIQACIDSSRVVGDKEMYERALRAQAQLPHMALEYEFLYDARSQSSSDFERAEFQEKMGIADQELERARDYFQKQHELLEEILASLGKTSASIEELSDTAKFSQLLEDDVDRKVVPINKRIGNGK